jgi:hypothetical protein
VVQTPQKLSQKLKIAVAASLSDDTVGERYSWDFHPTMSPLLVVETTRWKKCLPITKTFFARIHFPYFFDRIMRGITIH